MKHTLFLLFIFFFIVGFSTKTLAQEIQKTKAGDFIVVMPDGSWENYNPKNVEHKKMMKTFEQKKKATAEQAKKEQSNTSKQKTDTNETAKNAKNNAVDINKYLKILEEERAKGIFADNMYLQRLEYEQQLVKFKSQPNLKKNDPAQKRIENFLAEAKNNEKSAKKDFDKISKKADDAREVLKKAKVDTKKYPVYVLRCNLIEKNNEKTDETTKKTTTEKKKNTKPPKTKDSDKKTAPQKVKIKKEGKIVAKDTVKITKNKVQKAESLPAVTTISTKDVATNDAECNIVFEGIDEFTKRKKRETKPQQLFQFTDEGMNSYYEDKDFLTCEVNISAVEGSYKYMVFTFTFASENVANAYGWLEKDNLLMLKFIDGSTLNLFNSRTDRGQVNVGEHTTTYKAICIIGAGEEKILQKREVDAIRIMWSTGTEDYDIYDVDFFANQLKCLSKK